MQPKHTSSASDRRYFVGVTILLGVLLFPAAPLAQEISNIKSGISAIWGGKPNIDYCEEYYFSNRDVYDAKTVFIRNTTPITLIHNSRNNANYHVRNGGRQIIGENGLDGIPATGDEGVIRYKIDRDRQYFFKWSDNSARTETTQVLPAYTNPFTLSQQYFEPGIPVVGTTGSNGRDPASRSLFYFRGLTDSAGDEWHVLSYADDDSSFLRLSTNFVDQAFYTSDGKTVNFVVDPKTPCLTIQATGTGQFYTTPAKVYWSPIIHDQTTYISAGSSGGVSIQLCDLYGKPVSYRINGAPWVNPATNLAIISHTSFRTGTNLLEFISGPTSTNIRSRTVVRDPVHPSVGEQHGRLLWETESALQAMKLRLSRSPYSSYYALYKTRGDFSGQDEWDSTSGRGLRISPTYALKNAFVAFIEGANYTRDPNRKTFAQYAKEMLLEQSRNIDPIGFELSHSSDAIPNRELHFRGYIDSQPLVESAFAYDLLVSFYRSDQHPKGITPIEDIFIRDRLASFAFEAMQWTGGMTLLGAPGMWGGARIIASTCIAMAMPEYSTRYYGTSGFGSIQTVFPLCPYDFDKLTWKQALFDGTATRSQYPNYQWSLGLSDNGLDSLIMDQNQDFGGRAYPFGTWADKGGYFSSGLMETYCSIWANMALTWGGKRTDGRLSVLLQNCANGTFIGAKDPYPQAPSRRSLILLINSRWPEIASLNRPWVQSLPSDNSNSASKALQDAGIFGFAWYDDGFESTRPSAPRNLRQAN